MSIANTYLSTKPAGKTLFVSDIPSYQKGDPAPSELAPSYNLTCTEWQFRILAEIKENPESSIFFHTFTFAREPSTDEKACKLIDKYLRRVKRWHKEVQLPAARELLDEQFVHPKDRYQAKLISANEGKFRYFVALERGSKKGRRHFHALTFTPGTISTGDWRQTGLKWKHGIHDRSLLRPEHQISLGWYLAKYVSKSQGRTRCSSQFGLTTTILLLSNAASRLLATINPATFQKLLRRLLLTPNYPTSKKLNYLMSSDNALTTSLPRHLKQLRLAIGETSGLSKPETDGGNIHSSKAISICSKACIRQIIIDLRRADKHGLLSASLPGLRYFGRPHPLRLSSQLAADSATAIWYRCSHYPRIRRNIAQRKHVLLGKPAGDEQ